MNNAAFAAALKRLADIKYMEADALNEWAAALDTGAPASAPAGRAATPSAAPAGAPSFDELPPEASPFEQDAVLSECPVHFTPWTVKEGGISKAGKPYRAFWKCNGTNADGTYCSKKPVKAWADSHPAEAAA